jgi:hypothetical protein
VAEAHAWAREECHSLGIAIAAPIHQVHLRPWSVVFRVPTSGGALLHRHFRGLVPDSGAAPIRFPETLTFGAVARAYSGVNDTDSGGLAGSLRRVPALFR